MGTLTSVHQHNRFSRKKDSPMHKDTAAGIESILYELVAGWEVFEQILIVDIVNLDNFVIEASE